MGSNFLLTFLGWEGVGLCSYLLISFWFERNSAAVAGKKAFVTNRVGDFGFMLAMFLIFQHLGTLELRRAAAGPHADEHDRDRDRAAAVPRRGGQERADSRSTSGCPTRWKARRRFRRSSTPRRWSPRACSSSSARTSSSRRNYSGTVVAWIGAITALFAATIALQQNDIKKVLAYSTISQLGYMFLAVGVGAYGAAIFLMVTHAFFKALLFLGAGSVIHGIDDEQDMRRMGGLKKYMPITAGTFIVGWLAIAGIFPFAGFWSKDEILAKTFFEHDYALWVIGVLGRVPHRVLHDPPGVAGLLRQRALEPRRGPDPRSKAKRTPRAREHARAARVAAAHVDPAGRARRAVRSSAGSSCCRSRPGTSTCSTAGSSRCSPTRATGLGSFAASATLSIVALVVAVAGIVICRRDLPEGPQPRRLRPGRTAARRRSPTFSPTRTTSTSV